MSTDLVPVSSFDLLPQANSLADAIAQTDFVPRARRGKPAAVMACVLSGHEIGIGPMQSLQKIHVIDGRPAMAAELMRALILRDGHDLWVEDQTATKVTVCGQRAGSQHQTRVTWTLDDAKRANLAGKQNWRNYPRAMLLARATAELARMTFADVIGGLYAVEEVQDGFVYDEPDINAEVDVPAPSQRRKPPATKKAAATRKSATPRAAATPRPPLPGEEEGQVANVADPTPPPAEAEDTGTDVLSKRRQQIAMRCNEAGLDRAQLIHAVTGGRTTSARELDGPESADVLEALRQIKVGELGLDTSGDEPLLVGIDEQTDGEAAFNASYTDVTEDVVDAEVLDDEEGESASGWDGTAWRTFLKAHGVTVVDAVKWAQAKAKDLGVDQPGGAAQFSDDPTLAAALHAWVEERGSE